MTPSQSEQPEAREPQLDNLTVKPGQRATPSPRPIPDFRPVRRSRWRVFKRLFGWILTIAVLCAVIYIGYIVSIVAKISTNSFQLGSPSADASGRTNVLLLGVGDPGHAGEGLSDTMMVVSFDSVGKHMAYFSIPRDLRVEIPGYGSSKINAADVYGGVKLAEQTVSNTLQAPINYYVKTDFSGLKGIVDAVGGLDIDVKDHLVDTEYPCDDNQYRVCGLDIKPGMQHMDGARVLQYVRCRKGTCGNDFGRAARQQEVIGLLKPKILDWSLVWQPVRLQKLV
ncbi:MAG TPA: LCP family protein, partial [Candidatus Saccharimonadia bacterium]|nr:LCP family protein [Candidatus Saccharimonadia bacterium]